MNIDPSGSERGASPRYRPRQLVVHHNTNGHNGHTGTNVGAGGGASSMTMGAVSGMILPGAGVGGGQPSTAPGSAASSSRSSFHQQQLPPLLSSESSSSSRSFPPLAAFRERERDRDDPVAVADLRWSPNTASPSVIDHPARLPPLEIPLSRGREREHRPSSHRHPHQQQQQQQQQASQSQSQPRPSSSSIKWESPPSNPYPPFPRPHPSSTQTSSDSPSLALPPPPNHHPGTIGQRFSPTKPTSSSSSSSMLPVPREYWNHSSSNRDDYDRNTASNPSTNPTALAHVQALDRDRDRSSLGLAFSRNDRAPSPSYGTEGSGNGATGVGADEDKPKAKKRRVALACKECSKRKQRCDRKFPCNHCTARRVPELCVPVHSDDSPSRTSAQLERVSPQAQAANGVMAQWSSEAGNGARFGMMPPPPRTNGQLPTLTVRVSRLEGLVNAMVNRVEGIEGSSALREFRINHPPVTSPPPLSYRALLYGVDRGIDLASPTYDREQSPEEASAERRMRPDDGPMDRGDSTEGEEGAVASTLDRDSLTRNPLPQSLIRSEIPLGIDYHGTPTERLQRLFQDCGVDPIQVQSLVSELPPQPLATDLVDWFFNKINFVRYPIAEDLFRRSLGVLYESRNLEAVSVISLPLAFIVFAMAIRVAPTEWVGPEERRRTYSLKMYWNSRTATMLSSAVKAESLQLVETKILTGLYLVLMHERRLAEGWCEFRSALTMGQAIGLHRDGTKLRLDPYVSEYRRRLWSYLAHADATYSCLLGRPTSIDASTVDTKPPSNIDLRDLSIDHDTKPKPLEEPTFATYLILRYKLGMVVAKMTAHFQRLQGVTTYRDVEELDADFKTFVRELPATFRMIDPDRSYDKDLWFLPVHRYYIQTEVLHFIIILHRPWLLRKLRSTRYALSRRACFDAAVTDWKVRNAFKVDCPDFFETLLGGSFREFNSAMIAGISVIIDPSGPHADDMRALMKSFMEQHPTDPNADDFSQKEVGIIYTLHRRAKEIESRRRARRGSVLLADKPGMAVSSERDKPNLGSAPPAQANAPQDQLSRAALQQTPQSGSTVYGAATPMRSPLTSFRNREVSSVSGHSVQGSSHEEDHPQNLLDHWLMSNTQFGPQDPAITFDPFTDPSLPFAVDPADLTHTGLGQQTFLGGPGSGLLNGATYNGGLGGWADPNLAGGGPMLGMGMADPGVVPGALTGGLRMDFQSGDGNSSLFWNTLVDGIVGNLGLPGSATDTYGAPQGGPGMGQQDTTGNHPSV